MDLAGKAHPPRLKAVAGLKIVALLLVFIWHSPLPTEGVPDLGARCVELFFVASGFLVAYSRHGRFSDSVAGAMGYALGKARRAYPVYLLSLALSIVWLFLTNGSDWLTPGYLLALPFHLILCQSWVSGIAMLYNGAAWFFSAALVCYVLAPAIDSVLGELSKRLGARGGATALLLGSAVARLLVELGVRSDPAYFPVALHTSPPVRALEFSMAYGAGALFLLASGRTETKSAAIDLLVASVVELSISALVVYTVVRFDGVWPRAYYVFMFVPVVYVFARGEGFVSQVLSLPIFERASGIELEFYLLHQPVIRVVTASLALAGIVWVKKAAAIALVVTVALSALFALAPRLIRREGRSHGQG